MGGLVIRRAQPCDLDDIARIQGRSSWKPSDFLNYDCCVALEDDRVAGFVASRETAPAQYEILFIAVDPAYRRRGIARKLLENALARSTGEWFLEVRESNIAAISLYESLGFEPAATRQDYYSDPHETAIVMRFFS